MKEMKQQQQQLVGRVGSAIKKPGNMTPNTQISANNEITGVQSNMNNFNNFQSAFDNYNYQITPIVTSGLSTNESSQHNP